ncbi:sulfotransferase family protein [Brevundimonas diminuta]|uniref:Sulfotransferase family protein n=1 Tax=Brevundimonas diminuta TaxID=293 RepID=A0A2X1AGU1_BREDI|nr:sulfotransferase family protein [Brevundimonas diminuta]SPU44083.1 Uncharacterised protein [Brevundimonas diminuta]
MRLAFVVLGMHRSGTSSVAGLLALLGATPPRTLMGPKPDNPKGFWESEVLMAFDDEILSRAGSAWDDPEPLDQRIFAGELGTNLRQRAAEKLHEEFGKADSIVIKDPRICRFYPFWRQVLESADYQPFVVLPIRDPAEVAASLHGRNGMPVDKGLALWRRHVEDAELATRGQRRHILLWRDLLGDWRSALARLEANLGRPLDLDDPTRCRRIEDFLSPDLSRHLGQAYPSPDKETQSLYARVKRLAVED